ncbi:hypothetical protein Tco_0624871 [Tanacetum coccineum]|uniref:Uncharacterized protein n=1 Tax=Tanacetum coccineum TaxID=301880 RepID=A0ABQ4WFB9_9ASTR
MNENDEGREDYMNEFPAIVFNNTSDTTPLYKPTVSPPNESELDFRISCDESDDEDYMVIFDENSFSYKIVFGNDLKIVLENDDSSLTSSPNPTIDHDSDYFNNFKNEFPAIVYNDGLTSKSDLGIKTLISANSTDEFNFIDETSLSEYDEEIISCFNDLFNDTHFIDSRSEIDNYDNNIDMAPLPAANQRHPWLRYEVEGYTPSIDLVVRIRMVYHGEGQHVFVSRAWRRLFEIRTPLIREFILEFLSTCRMSDTIMDLDTADTLCFQLGGARRRMIWRKFILVLGLHTEQEMAEAGCGAYWAGSDQLIPDKGDLRDYYILGRGQAPEKVTGVDLFDLCSMDHETINVPHLLAKYLFRHAKGRKSEARLSGGHFIGRLAMHFGLVTDEGLRGLQGVTRELPLIDLHELGRLHICTRYGDTWTWVAQGPERQHVVAAGAPEVNEDGQGAEEVALEILAPALTQAPPPPPPAPQPCLRGDVASFTMKQSTVSTWLISCMTQLMDTSGQTYQPFDSTLVGSSGLSFRRRVRPRAGEASTSAAPHTDA